MKGTALERLVIVGGGRHSKVAIDIIRRAAAYDVVGFTDPSPDARSLAPRLGGDDVLTALRRDGVRFAFVAIGDNRRRRERAQQLEALGFVLARAICPSAVVSPHAAIEAGCMLGSGSVVNADARIGPLAIVNTRAAIDHDCVIGTAAHVAPGATLAGDVVVGDLALVGAGATVINGIAIGPGAVCGAGSVVVDPVPAGRMVVGIPARLIRPDAVVAMPAVPAIQPAPSARRLKGRRRDASGIG